MVWARVSKLPLPASSFMPEGVRLPREEASGLGSPPELAGPRLTLHQTQQMSCAHLCFGQTQTFHAPNHAVWDAISDVEPVLLEPRPMQHVTG